MSANKYAVFCWVLVAVIFLPQSSSATAIFCAVSERTNDGFVSVRSGPGVDYEVLGKIFAGDFLYVGTERCREDFGSIHCSNDGKWVFVEDALRNSKSIKLKGWAKNSLIRQITCPDN